MSWLVSASLGAAQEPSDATSITERARAHFERGVEHYSEGNYAAALAELQRSYELSPTYKLLYNLAQVQTELHDYAAALGSFSEYLRSGGAGIAAERRSAVEQEIERLRQRSAELDIEVDVADARVFVNARPVGTSPLQEPVRVNVGSVTVRAEKPGSAPFEQSLSVAGGDRRRVDAVLTPLMAAQPAAAAPPKVVTTPNMIPSWIGLGSALALGGAAATFGVLSLNARQQQDDLLATYPGRPSELDAASGRLRTFAALTDAFAAASLVAGVVGLYFLWSPPEHRSVVPADRAQLRLSATPTTVAVSGTF